MIGFRTFSQSQLASAFRVNVSPIFNSTSRNITFWYTAENGWGPVGINGEFPCFSRAEVARIFSLNVTLPLGILLRMAGALSELMTGFPASLELG